MAFGSLKGLGHDNGRRASLPPAIALRYLWLGGWSAALMVSLPKPD